MSISKPSVTYILQNARIVAVLEGGGAIIEHRDIEYEEGRVLMYDGDDRDTPQLGFSCSFTVVGSEAPDMVELKRAHLVIEGDCEGQRIELRGEGHFGYTEKGDCEGDFLLAPAIILERDPKPATTSVNDNDDEEMGDDEMAEWLEHQQSLSVLAPDEYRRAQRAPDAEKRVLMANSPSD